MKKNIDFELYSLRHSSAHVLAAALKNLWPAIMFGIGPVIDEGFYYDIYLDNGQKLSEDDFPKIEAEMKNIISNNDPFIQYDLDFSKALDWSKKNKQKFKTELINDLIREGTTNFADLNKSEIGTFDSNKTKSGKVSFYKCGDFEDLCRGPHIQKTGDIKAFKLLKLSGAYWRGDSKNIQMQRIYGISFFSQAKLDNYITLTEQARQRDHRKLGTELDLFVFSDLVGSGLPMFTPRGTVLREQIINYSNELRLKYHFQKVFIPHITKKDLYEVSGHWAKFGDELFLVKSQETSDQLVLKPMNCPHHTRIYASKPRSYRELPIRYLETTTVYRDEKSGELGGLNRVRSITQDDSHVFCQDDLISQEIDKLLACAKELYSTVGMSLKVRLSYRDDSDNYLGSKELWEKSQQQLKTAVENNSLEFVEETGEAAFYGPKIDFMVTDALGREHQLATIQLDFVQPERFKLRFTNELGEEESPVMIHSALLGSIERFLSVYIEHTGGRFPVWNAPEQVRLITINQQKEIIDFAESISNKAFDMGLRLTVDSESESISKKIRQAELMKVPYTIVIGEKELLSSNVTPRIRSDLKDQILAKSELNIDEFLKIVSQEANLRISKSTF